MRQARPIPQPDFSRRCARHMPCEKRSLLNMRVEALWCTNRVLRAHLKFLNEDHERAALIAIQKLRTDLRHIRLAQSRDPLHVWPDDDHNENIFGKVRRK